MRLWPESRKLRPKQLITLFGERSFLQQTSDRMRLVCDGSIHVVAGSHLRKKIEEQLPDAAFIEEPCARNTSACIALAAIMCLEKDPDAIMAVLPADHLISPQNLFAETMKYAAQWIDRHPEKLLTLGIPPRGPVETFGYIERAALLNSPDDPCVFEVKRFREKPSRQTAEEFISTGAFFWNAGIFVWKARTILDYLREYAPDIFAPVERIQQALGREDFSDTLRSEFARIPNISIDYAVLEPASKQNHVAVLGAAFEWDDVGSWRALEQFFPHDDSGNCIASSVEATGANGAMEPIFVESRDCLVRSSDTKKRVVCCATEGLGVVVADDVILVFDKNCEESLRKITKKLQELNCEELL